MVVTREVSYAADGLTMVGHLARPDGAGPWPAVLVGHDGVGLDDVQRRFADDLAARGHVAFALDYHGGRWFSDPQEMLARSLPLLADPDRLRAVGRAGLEVLRAEPGADTNRLSAVGLGAGGTVVLELARSGVAFRALAAVHPGLPFARADDWVGVPGTFLLCTGALDPISPPEQLLAFGRLLGDAGVDWRAQVLGGAEHAFWHPAADAASTLPGVGHHPVQATRMWRAVLDLVDEVVVPAP